MIPWIGISYNEQKSIWNTKKKKKITQKCPQETSFNIKKIKSGFFKQEKENNFFLSGTFSMCEIFFLLLRYMTV